MANSDPNLVNNTRNGRAAHDNVHVTGEIEANIPANVLAQFKAALQENTPRDNCRFFVDNCRFFVEVLTLFVVAIYAYLTCCEFSLDRKQFEFTQKQIVNAQQAVVEANLEFSPKGTIDVTLINEGHSPAQNVCLRFTRTRYSLPDYRQLGSGVSEEKCPPNSIFPLGPPGQPRGGTTPRQYRIPELNGNDLAELDTAKQTIKIDGNLTYENGFGEAIKVPLCQEYLASTTFDKAGNVSSTVKQFWPCDGFDDRVKVAVQNQKNPNTQ
jgi:hypothetical protein